MGHTYSDLLLHIVFSTKDRRPLLDRNLRVRLLSYLGGIAADFSSRVVAAGGT